MFEIDDTTSALLLNNMLYLKPFGTCFSPIMVKKAMFCYTEKIHVIRVTSELLQYHFTVGIINFISFDMH